MKNCSSCKATISNDKAATCFKCPACNKETICRCSNCRKTATNYTCACGFKGP